MPGNGREYSQRYYRKNRKRILAQQREYRSANREKVYACSRAWVARNPERQRRALRSSHLRRKYGMSVEQYEEMLSAQRGRCAVCRARTDLVVDHHHGTGRVRGLICRPCNSALTEHAERNIHRLAKYLKER
jgi:hypothetical protein